LHVSGRGISGTLPPWVLQVAFEVTVTNTSVTGPLPSLPADEQSERTPSSMQISGNPKLSGTLPASWPAALRRPTIDLSNNALIGTIPDSWASFNWKRVNLSGNRLSGSIRAWAQPFGTPSVLFLSSCQALSKLLLSEHQQLTGKPVNT
jgi:hypothetical protein